MTISVKKIVVIGQGTNSPPEIKLGASERERERQIGRNRQTQRQRQAHRQRYRDRVTDGRTGGWTDRRNREAATEIKEREGIDTSRERRIDKN